jgi:hypothetical protein
MNTKVKLNEDELQDIWSALAYFIKHYPDDGAKITKSAMAKIIIKIRKSK